MSRHRNFVFTLNNYTNEHLEHYNLLTCKYVVYGKEIAPTTGTPHLQGYIAFEHAKTLSAAIRLLPGSRVAIANGTPMENFTYCSKGGDFVERGERPRTPEDGGDMEIARWATAFELAKAGRIHEIDPQILIRHYGNLNKIAMEHMPKPKDLDTTCGIWIFGPSGSGKSRGARIKYPELYSKPLNKWWDGYRGEETVLVDDVDPGHAVWIGSFLKIWADHYGFINEHKGKSTLIRPKRLLVTSQYEIEYLWSGQPELIEAIKRRFQIIRIRTGASIQWPPEEEEFEELSLDSIQL